MEERAREGPRKVVKICTGLAPKIVGRLSQEQGWRVAGEETKGSNPLLVLGMPQSGSKHRLGELWKR